MACDPHMVLDGILSVSWEITVLSASVNMGIALTVNVSFQSDSIHK